MIFGLFQDMRPSFEDDRQIASKLTFDVQAQFVKLDFAEMPHCPSENFLNPLSHL
jgi:hypothetical protein